VNKLYIYISFVATTEN